MVLRGVSRPGGTVEYTVSLSKSQAAALGQDSMMLLRHVHTVLAGLAALRSGVWGQDGASEHEPGVWDWAAVIEATAALGELGQAVTAAAVREHAALGGTTEQLGDAMGRPPGTAQNRRQAWIGTRAQPVAPAGPELWARGVGRPPA